MVMDAFGIEMGADHRLKLPAEQPVRKFQPDLMGQFRGNLSSGKAFAPDGSPAPFFLMPHFFDLAHILEGSIAGAAEGGLKQVLLGFIFVEGFIDFPLQ